MVDALQPFLVVRGVLDFSVPRLVYRYTFCGVTVLKPDAKKLLVRLGAKTVSKQKPAAAAVSILKSTIALNLI